MGTVLNFVPYYLIRTVLTVALVSITTLMAGVAIATTASSQNTLISATKVKAISSKPRRARKPVRRVAAKVSTKKRTAKRRARLGATAGATKKRRARGVSSVSARVNGGRVGIISGGIGGTYIRIATDLASVLNQGDSLRILPIVGQGSVQNITDILYLKGIDVGIVQSDVLAYIKSKGLHRNIEQRIQYITKLYNEEFHLVGGREINDIRELEGKSVNFGVKGSGTHMTATTVFEKLGIAVNPVSYDQALAIEKIRNGEIAATVFVAGKPARAVADLKGAYGLRLIPVGYGKALQKAYLPARFSNEDYPELVPAGETVDSIAVGAVMAVYNWPGDNPRRQRVKRFINAFFARLDEFQQEPRHKKWREVNLAAKVPGWKRFRAADTWLAQNAATGNGKLRTAFNAFLTEAQGGGKIPLEGAAREKLFRKFIEWRRQNN